MGEKRNLVVQWKNDGDWFASCNYLEGIDWQKRQSKARRFTSQAEFKAYCEEEFGMPFADITDVEKLRFVRLIPRLGLANRRRPS